MSMREPKTVTEERGRVCLFFVGSEEEALAAIDARLKEMSDDEG